MVSDAVELVPFSHVQDEYESDYRLFHSYYCEFYSDDSMAALVELLHQRRLLVFHLNWYFLWATHCHSTPIGRDELRNFA